MVLSFDIPDRVLVAIGGNATHLEDIEGTSREQKANPGTDRRADGSSRP